jgi:complement component 1 Q subcomponent-binding protein
VDVFAIDEVTMFEGENHSDECYAVAGDILDGYLYDLFMNLLAERGVDNAFVEELSQWCSAHEHGQYLALLGELERWSKL